MKEAYSPPTLQKTQQPETLGQNLAEGEVVLLTLYAKEKTDNITGAKLNEIRRALEE